jgi:hypothetical protein
LLLQQWRIPAVAIVIFLGGSGFVVEPGGLTPPNSRRDLLFRFAGPTPAAGGRAEA